MDDQDDADPGMRRALDGVAALLKGSAALRDRFGDPLDRLGTAEFQAIRVGPAGAPPGQPSIPNTLAQRDVLVTVELDDEADCRDAQLAVRRALNGRDTPHGQAVLLDVTRPRRDAGHAIAEKYAVFVRNG